jgi:hypothetical protein
MKGVNALGLQSAFNGHGRNESEMAPQAVEIAKIGLGNSVARGWQENRSHQH